jgi:hypothetical protein
MLAPAHETKQNLFIYNFYMSEAQLSNPHKRPHKEQYPLPAPLPSKRQKVKHHVRYIEPPAFWDSLSKVWLTKRALIEFNRRNNAPHSSNRSAHRPITRAFNGERKKIPQPISTGGFLRRFVLRRLKDLKRFGRRGGSDLSDLIGVCEIRFLNGVCLVLKLIMLFSILNIPLQKQLLVKLIPRRRKIPNGHPLMMPTLNRIISISVSTNMVMSIPMALRRHRRVIIN